jgi:transposase-like protein
MALHTLDGNAASHRAVHEMRTDGLLSKRTKLRSSKYLNNIIEQDHRGIKSRTRPMLGFKNFNCAAITIAGIELLLVSTRVSSLSAAYGSKTKLRLPSGRQSGLQNRQCLTYLPIIAFS